MKTENLPRVYVTQELPVSYQQAERHGEVVFLSSQATAIHSDSMRNADILRDMIAGMKDYRSGVDFLVPSGSPLTIGLGFMIASWKGPAIKVLQWNNRKFDYDIFTVDFDKLMDRATGPIHRR